MIEIKNKKGKQYWKSLNELADTPQFNTFLQEEFPGGTDELPSAISRKKFLSLMGASMALAGLAGCRRPVEKILPYVAAPENIIPGIPNYYATSIPFGVNALGVVVESHEGRPTKIEGNEKHSSSLGKADAFTQASILNLYDPDRAQIPALNGNESTWDAFSEDWAKLKEQYSQNKGKGLIVISNSFNSPSLLRTKKLFSKTFPKAQWIVYDAVNDENIYNGLHIATGKKYQPVYHFDKADVVLSLDADFMQLESNSVSNTIGFSSKRRVDNENDSMNRLYAVESSLSVTGSMADHRLRIQNSQIPSFIATLANELRKLGNNIISSSNLKGFGHYKENKQFLKVLAKDLTKAKGKSLIVAGRNQSAEIHALVFAINESLKNNNKTVSYYSTDEMVLSNKNNLFHAVSKMKNNEYSTCVILGANPVYDAVNLDFKNALTKVKHTIFLGSHADETAQAVNWHLPESHVLESWGDTRSFDGTYSIIQPLIAPLFDTKSMGEFVSILLGNDDTYHDFTKKTFKTFNASNSGSKWRKALHDGVLSGSSYKSKKTKLKASRLAQNLKTYSANFDEEAIEITLLPSNSTFDGSYSNNGWMMESSDPITKVTWENVAQISLSTAKKLGIANEEIITINNGINSISIPAWIMPGHADNSITLTMGYGRNMNGRIADSAGANILPIFSFSATSISNASITGTGTIVNIASTQDHHGMDLERLAKDAIQERLLDIVRESSLDDYQSNPDFAKQYAEKTIEKDGKLPSMWERHKYDTGYQWGMAIDLNVCNGCNACSIACQSENNIPVVGKEEVEKGREMSWIRIDRYFKGDDIDNPEIALQPVGCQHCEMAPCEAVCPVAATTHDDEGLNTMVYNRCIGTRYCANNCPYKVRRFNFHNYTKDMPEVVQMAQNPDVTVRFRGVMEKCTYCVQRIKKAEITAKNDNVELNDGDVIAACQQTCPSEAIVFGNINDPNSKVSKLKEQNKNYLLLGELNLGTRTSYLAKLRNPHPELNS